MSIQQAWRPASPSAAREVALKAVRAVAEALDELDRCTERRDRGEFETVSDWMAYRAPAEARVDALLRDLRWHLADL